MNQEAQTYNAATHFAALYASVPAQFSFRATTQAGWARWRDAFRPRLRQALGLDNMERDLAGFTPHAEMAQSENMGDHLRESWHLWVEPTVPLPFYLLRPKNAQGRLPLVLTPHGHNHPHIYAGIARNTEEEKSMREGERDIARQAVQEGYLAIAPTTRAFGELRTAEDQRKDSNNSCRIELMHGMLVGRTPLGERVWDISRLIDWAIARPDVDARRIACTGNSGGGTTTIFAAACDTRIAVAVPSCSFCTFRGSIGSIYHCDCNYVPGMLRLGEMYDVAGLTAPRPFRAVAGRSDEIFPIEHVRSAFARLQKIYSAAGAADDCRLYVGEGGHRYYKAGVWPFVRECFARDVSEISPAVQ